MQQNQNPDVVRERPWDELTALADVTIPKLANDELVAKIRDSLAAEKEDPEPEAAPLGVVGETLDKRYNRITAVSESMKKAVQDIFAKKGDTEDVQVVFGKEGDTIKITSADELTDNEKQEIATALTQRIEHSQMVLDDALVRLSDALENIMWAIQCREKMQADPADTFLRTKFVAVTESAINHEVSAWKVTDQLMSELPAKRVAQHSSTPTSGKAFAEVVDDAKAANCASVRAIQRAQVAAASSTEPGRQENVVPALIRGWIMTRLSLLAAIDVLSTDAWFALVSKHLYVKLRRRQVDMKQMMAEREQAMRQERQQEEAKEKAKAEEKDKAKDKQGQAEGQVQVEGDVDQVEQGEGEQVVETTQERQKQVVRQKN